MICPTVMRGLSELYGSWKITCIFRRIGRSAVSVRPVSVRPSKMISPAVGCSSCRTQRPSVVFPHPDSPTSPSVCPLAIEKLTRPRRAPLPSPRRTDSPPRQGSVCPDHKPVREGCHRPSPLRLTAELCRHPTGGQVIRHHWHQRWHLGLPAVDGLRTTESKGTPWRDIA